MPIVTINFFGIEREENNPAGIFSTVGDVDTLWSDSDDGTYVEFGAVWTGPGLEFGTDAYLGWPGAHFAEVDADPDAIIVTSLTQHLRYEWIENEYDAPHYFYHRVSGGSGQWSSPVPAGIGVVDVEIDLINGVDAFGTPYEGIPWHYMLTGFFEFDSDGQVDYQCSMHTVDNGDIAGATTTRIRLMENWMEFGFEGDIAEPFITGQIETSHARFARRAV